MSYQSVYARKQGEKGTVSSIAMSLLKITKKGLSCHSRSLGTQKLVNGLVTHWPNAEMLPQQLHGHHGDNAPCMHILCMVSSRAV